jgi:hypothetical protein
MSPITLTINERVFMLDIDPKMPLLWAIRDFDSNARGRKKMFLNVAIVRRDK